MSSESVQPQAEATDAGVSRPPPLVVHVRPGTRMKPPPQKGAGAVVMLATVAGIITLMGVVLLVSSSWACAAPLLALGVAGLALTILPRGLPLAVPPRVWTPAHFLELGRVPASGPRLAALAQEWKPIVVVSETSRTAIFRQAPSSEAGTVLCVGPVEVPDIFELRFEPVIITPSQRLWRSLTGLAPAVFLAALWLLTSTGLMPASFRPHLIYMWWFACSGLAGGVTWLWQTAARPRYIRLAPGIVQVLEYSFFGRHRTTRSYEMSRGSTVLVQQVGRDKRPGLLVFRSATHKDAFDLAGMKNRPAVTEAFWRAILSTAPHPPLSDHELIG